MLHHCNKIIGFCSYARIIKMHHAGNYHCWPLISDYDAGRLMNMNHYNGSNRSSNLHVAQPTGVQGVATQPSRSWRAERSVLGTINGVIALLMAWQRCWWRERCWNKLERYNFMKYLHCTWPNKWERSNSLTNQQFNDLNAIFILWIADLPIYFQIVGVHCEFDKICFFSFYSLVILFLNHDNFH